MFILIGMIGNPSWPEEYEEIDFAVVNTEEEAKIITESLNNQDSKYRDLVGWEWSKHMHFDYKAVAVVKP